MLHPIVPRRERKAYFDRDSVSDGGNEVRSISTIFRREEARVVLLLG